MDKFVAYWSETYDQETLVQPTSTAYSQMQHRGKHSPASNPPEAKHVAQLHSLIGAGTLRSYSDFITRIVKEQNEPVILVGRSLAGLVISQVAEDAPESIQKLVYLAAYLLPNGESIRYAHQSVPEVARDLSHLTFDQENGVVGFRIDRLRDMLYQDCSEEDIALAQILVTAEGMGALWGSVEIGQRFSQVPRVYIETSNDHGINVKVQRFMYQHLPCERVFSLPTSHSAFFAAPESLVDILVSLV